jgi:hypothetical protein
MAHPNTHFFTLINASTHNERMSKNTIPSWILQCTCYLPRRKCTTQLHPDNVRFLGTPPNIKPPITPQRQPQNSDNGIHTIATTYSQKQWHPANLTKYDILQPLQTQHGWNILPPIINTTGISSIHNPTIKQPINLNRPQHWLNKLKEWFSQILIKYLTYVILNWRNSKRTIHRYNLTYI